MVKAVKTGETYTSDNVRSIRPSGGLHPRHLEEIMGRRSRRDILPGTPLRWEDVGD